MELRPHDPDRIGPYVLLARLGAGGMGQVYQGRSPGGRLVAIKVIKEEILEHPDVLDRFRREAETVRSVRGPYIANLVDASLDAAAPPLWLATEYVAGPTLARAVASHGPLPAQTCRGLLAALAEGLAAVHAHGVTHRDLKPQNVILSAQGPQLIDFGIARGTGHSALTETGLASGTPGFTAPEVISENRTTPAADVFALGATVAYAATGRAPFGTGASLEVLYRTVERPADLDGIEPGLAALLADCLAKDPADRPALQEVVERCAVRTVLAKDPQYRAVVGDADGGPAVAVPYTPTELPYTPTEVSPAPRPPRGRRRAWTLGIAAGVALSVLATFGTLWVRDALDDRAGRASGAGPSAPAASSPAPQAPPSASASASGGGVPPYILLQAPNRDEWSNENKRCNLPPEERATEFQYSVTSQNPVGDAREPVRGKKATISFRFKFTVPVDNPDTPYYVSVGVKEPGDTAAGPVAGPNLSIGATSRPVAVTAGGAYTELTYPDDFRNWREGGKALPAVEFGASPGTWTVLFFHVTDTTHFASIACIGFRIS